MDLPLLLSLGGLALLDSTSIGTLFIPVWLLLTPGSINPVRVILYLATIATFYFLVGLGILLGTGPLIEGFGAIAENRIVVWVQLALGIFLFSVSFRFDGERSRRLGKPNRAARWRQRAASHDTSIRLLMSMALLAGIAEVATMLPYLAAIAILGTSETDVLSSTVLLAVYCLVMVTPALLLLLLRQLGQRLVQPVLTWLDTWVARHGESAVGWIIGIAGFLIARDAFAKLALPFL